MRNILYVLCILSVILTITGCGEQQDETPLSGLTIQNTSFFNLFMNLFQLRVNICYIFVNEELQRNPAGNIKVKISEKETALAKSIINI